jgi:hypothetical protein
VMWCYTNLMKLIILIAVLVAAVPYTVSGG